MIEQRELKIHQSSDARYFEDFLKFVDYEPLLPEIVKTQVIVMVQEHIKDTFQPENEEREQLETSMEVWAASPKSEIQERFSSEQVIEAAAQIIENSPEIQLKLKMDHVLVSKRSAI
ncbi:hypothetical protein NCCP133_32310 [Cytobacillus sp. NCCP-133]|nr:hypothetical protein NCCP133_32310 [Cytobacillus sp. NCCP-133]